MPYKHLIFCKISTLIISGENRPTWWHEAKFWLKYSDFLHYSLTCFCLDKVFFFQSLFVKYEESLLSSNFTQKNLVQKTFRIMATEYIQIPLFGYVVNLLM